MNQAHILNIGYPKCGTTWLWEALVLNQSIEDFSIKENNSLIMGTTVDQYCQQYTSDYSANFSPANLVLDQYVIEQLAQHKQIRASIILRPMVEIWWSLYNFLNIKDVDFSGFCYRLYDNKWQASPAVIIERWKKHFGSRFQIFWYKDLLADNVNFYRNYCDTMGLAANSILLPDKINQTTYRHKILQIDQDILDLLSIEDEKVSVYK